VRDNQEKIHKGRKFKMKRDEKKNMDKGSNLTNNETSEKPKFLEMLNSFFNMHKTLIITLGNIALFFISIFIGSYSGSDIPLLIRVRTVVIIALVIFACLSPVLIMHTIKCLRRFFIDETIEEKNLKLFENLSELKNSLQSIIAKFDITIDHNENYFRKVITHINDCPRVNNIVRKSYMIDTIDTTTSI